MDLDEYTSPNAVNFRNQFRQLSGYINSFIRTPLGDVGESEIQTFNLTTNMLRDNITDVERRLRLADVRFHHWVPTGILPSSINHLVSRLEQNIMVLCELADALVIDPPATQNEALAIEVGQTVMVRLCEGLYRPESSTSSAETED